MAGDNPWLTDEGAAVTAIVFFFTYTEIISCFGWNDHVSYDAA